MKNLMILVKMQLKEQLNFKRLDVENVSIFHIIASQEMNSKHRSEKVSVRFAANTPVRMHRGG